MPTDATLAGVLWDLTSNAASVQGISLDMKSIGDDGVTALAGALERGSFPKLQTIYLDWNRIGDEGAAALAGALERGSFPKLECIELYENNVGDEGAKALAGALKRGSFPALQVIGLSVNNVGNEGATAFAGALERGSFPKLHDIWLGGNNIEVEMKQQVFRAIADMHCRVRLVAFLGAELDRSPVTPAKRLLWRDGDRAVMVRVRKFMKC